MVSVKEITSTNDQTEMERDNRTLKRGEIYYVDLDDLKEITKHVYYKTRPALIISNDFGNLRSDTVIVALLTSSVKKDYLFQYKTIIGGKESVIMFEQILTIDKNRILTKLTELSSIQMIEAEQRLQYSLGLDRYSLKNLIGIDVIAMSRRRTKSGEQSFFEIALLFKFDQSITYHIPTEELQKLDASITENTDLDCLKNILDTAHGVGWLINSEFIHGNPISVSHQIVGRELDTTDKPQNSILKH